MIAITLENIERSFGTRSVIRDLSLQISGGDRLIVRGSNGSGKSTLLKILAGLLSPTAGTIQWEHRGEKLRQDQLRHVVGYAAPDLMMYPDLTPLENLDFFGRVRGLPSRDSNQKLLERVGLGDRSHDMTGELSTGLRHRLKLAFSLQADPAILLLDEPTSNLDDAGKDLVDRLLAESAERGGIVAVATNEPTPTGNREVELG